MRKLGILKYLHAGKFIYDCDMLKIFYINILIGGNIFFWVFYEAHVESIETFIYNFLKSSRLKKFFFKWFL